MTIQDPQHWLQQQTAQHPLTVLVFFRGGWCPFCQAYLRELNGPFREAIEAKGGKLVAVTSQSAGAAAEAHAGWGLGYEVLSEPENALARHFGVAITPKAATPLAEDPEAYPQGMAQPAVIALGARGEVLFRWAIDPSEMNLGGASDRPLPKEILEVIEAKQAGREASLAAAPRLDPAFLAQHYPKQHATFQAWVASMAK